MHLVEGIRKHGFRKWYERQLLQSHAHMLLLLLCAIGLLATFSVFSRSQPLADLLLDIGMVLLFAAVGLWAMRRYLFLLMHAEQVANQAVCSECKAYGRLAVVEVDHGGERVKVRCTKCQHGWDISQ